MVGDVKLDVSPDTDPAALATKIMNAVKAKAGPEAAKEAAAAANPNGSEAVQKAYENEHAKIMEEIRSSVANAQALQQKAMEYEAAAKAHADSLRAQAAEANKEIDHAKKSLAAKNAGVAGNGEEGEKQQNEAVKKLQEQLAEAKKKAEEEAAAAAAHSKAFEELLADSEQKIDAITSGKVIAPVAAPAPAPAPAPAQEPAQKAPEAKKAADDKAKKADDAAKEADEKAKKADDAKKTAEKEAA